MMPYIFLRLILLNFMILHINIYWGRFKTNEINTMPYWNYENHKIANINDELFLITSNILYDKDASLYYYY